MDCTYFNILHRVRNKRVPKELTRVEISRVRPDNENELSREKSVQITDFYYTQYCLFWNVFS